MMRRPSTLLARVAVLAVVALVAAGAAFYYLTAQGQHRTVTARFASAVGVYPGTPLKILGVEVGKVTRVEPSPGYVSITMQYPAKYKVPANAIAVVVSNSLVSDRYLQLAPAYSGHGPTLPDDSTIPLSRTASPAELDDIYSALNKLSVALGPKGANRHGALSTLVDVAAANLKGNGAKLGTSISALSDAARTLADGRGDLFTTVRNLATFTKALSDSDAQVRHFEQQLATVSSDLANERADLGTALHELSAALDSVAKFVNANAGKAHTDIVGLEAITKILVKERASLDESLSIGPVALSNLVHMYQPDLGVLGTRSNLSSLTDPGQVCQLVDGLVTAASERSPLKVLLGKDGLLTKILGPSAAQIVSTCKQVVAKLPDTSKMSLPIDQLNGLLDSLLSGGLGGLIGAGG